MTHQPATRLAKLLGLVLTLACLSGSGALGQAGPSFDAWRQTVMRAMQHAEGCFKVTYPSTELERVACVTAPNRPYPPVAATHGGSQIVGNGIDMIETTPALITSGFGAFDTVQGLTSIASNSYSLQLNSNLFNTSACNGHPNCQGWQQFIYSNMGFVFMQYWLVNYGSPCPSGWFTSAPNCYKNSNAAAVPVQPVSAFPALFLFVSASNGGNDTVFLSGGYSVSAPDSVLHLSQAWNVAEYNVFGDGGGSQAIFNQGTAMAVRTEMNAGYASPPTCTVGGFSGETNSLTLVPPCCPYGIYQMQIPAIVFWQSSNPNASSSCANGTSLGDTHIANLDGLRFDFQARGDFLLARTDPGFVVQTRQVSGAPVWPLAAVNFDLGMRMGDHEVGLCTEPDRLIVDGKREHLESGGTLQEDGVLIQRQGNVYSFTRPNGAYVAAEPKTAVLGSGFTRYINVTVGLGQSPVALMTGLMGNGNGQAGPDDLITSGGTALYQPISFQDLYQAFGDSWRVPPRTSLVRKMCGNKGYIADNPSAPFFAENLDPELRAEARKICRHAGVRDKELLAECTLDVAVLGEKAAKVFAQEQKHGRTAQAMPPRGGPPG